MLPKTSTIKKIYPQNLLLFTVVRNNTVSLTFFTAERESDTSGHELVSSSGFTLTWAIFNEAKGTLVEITRTRLTNLLQYNQTQVVKSLVGSVNVYAAVKYKQAWNL